MSVRALVPSLAVAALAAIGFFHPSTAASHCDGLDGPVPKAARAALERGDVNLVLIWVRPAAEQEIRDAFATTLAVRRLGAEAAELADRWFFETLVRVHRAGEGAAFTGLKPAGRDLGPAIPAADRALESGNSDALVKLLQDAMQAGIRERFRKALASRSYRPADVQRGREHVESYVTFIHYVERLYQAATAAVHMEEPGTAAGHGAEPH